LGTVRFFNILGCLCRRASEGCLGRRTIDGAVGGWAMEGRAMEGWAAGVDLRESPRTDGRGNQRLADGRRHAVRVHLRVERLHPLVGDELAVEVLLLADGAVLVSKQQRLEVDHLLPQLRDLGVQGVVLRSVGLDLGLQIGQPGLLTLTTFQGGNARLMSAEYQARCGLGKVD
jgi:hypothetical protein